MLRRQPGDTKVDKSQYRCSLINLEHSQVKIFNCSKNIRIIAKNICQDDELDAILGELSELETQFSKEIVVTQGQEARKRSSDESRSDQREKYLECR